MSAGTMIACACNEIIMGRHSNLGPIDPQVAGLPAHGVIEEFRQVQKEISDNPTVGTPIWQPIIAKYSPTLVGECRKAIVWSEEMVKKWLTIGMFDGDPDASTKAANVVDQLGSHEFTKSHNSHVSAELADSLGLRVTPLEENEKLQDAILTVHHSYIQTLAMTGAVKIIENQLGVAFIQTVQALGTAAVPWPGGSIAEFGDGATTFKPTQATPFMG